MTSRIQFTVADESHDAGMRRLLRDVPMPGSIKVSLQREPSYFAAAGAEGAEHHAIVALEGAEVVGMGSLSARDRFLNGQSARVGYLGGLRLASAVQGRFDIVRRGYALLKQLSRQIGVEAIFTTIATDNERAISLLERRIPGMPTYAPVGELVTLLLRVNGRNAKSDDPLGHVSSRALIERVNESMSQFQFAPRWSESECTKSDFAILTNSNGVDACAAFWDQRHFKQAVVTHYPIHLKVLAALGRLPRVGHPLSQAFVSHLTCPMEKPELLTHLIDRLASRASAANIDMLCIGLDSRDRRLKMLQRSYSARSYRTRLYRVSWEDAHESLPHLDGRLVYPEVALL